MGLTFNVIAGLIGVAAIFISLVWFANLGGIKERIFVKQKGISQ